MSFVLEATKLSARCNAGKQLQKNSLRDVESRGKRQLIFIIH